MIIYMKAHDYLYAGVSLIYMQAHDFLFADTADDSTTGIKTRHRRASEETRGASEET